MLGLSKEEDTVFESIRRVQMTARAVQIAQRSGVDRQKTNRILKDFQKRSIVILHRKIDRLRICFLKTEDILAMGARLARDGIDPDEM